jgi:hypothetical protein
MRNPYRIVVGNSECQRPPKKHGRRWQDNIKMDLKEIGYKGVYWIHME